MSININDKKFNKRKRKKRKGIEIEDYARENNINLNISLDYENSPEKVIKTDSHTNSNESPKFDKYSNNKLDIKLDLKFRNQNSASTINSSSDDDIKEREKEKEKGKEKETEKERKELNNKFEQAFLKTQILNHINNNKINGYPQNNINNNIQYNPNNYNFNSYQNYLNINQKLFSGVKQYYTNINENHSNNHNYYLDNRFDKDQMNIYLRNLQNNMVKTYLNDINTKLKNCYICYNRIYSFNLEACLKKLEENEKNLNIIKNQISLVQKKTINDMILSAQMCNLINYINKKRNIPNIDNNNIFCENLTHPHFYTNHNEEIQVKNILYLIEGLFLEENLIDDFNLIKILDRDGYASLTDLEKHPQLINFKIKMKDLKIVFLEHRINEITETVETFDDILIRNKDWKNIKKKHVLNHKTVYQNSLNKMGQQRLNKIQSLMGKKSEYIQIKDRLCFQYHFITQKMKQLQANFNGMNNIYNNNNNNFYINNNINNINNIYNNNFIFNKYNY